MQNDLIPNNEFLMPKLKHKFRVLFLKNGQIIPGSEVLSGQVIKVSKIKHNLKSDFNSNNKIKITYEDDVRCQAGKIVQDIIKESFEIAISTLNGNDEVLDTLTLKECSIFSIDHGNFSYCPTHNSKEITINNPILSDVDQLQNSDLKYILALFKNTKIISTNKHGKNGAVNKKLKIKWKSCEYSIATKATE